MEATARKSKRPDWALASEHSSISARNLLQRALRPERPPFDRAKCGPKRPVMIQLTPRAANQVRTMRAGAETPAGRLRLFIENGRMLGTAVRHVIRRAEGGRRRVRERGRRDRRGPEEPRAPRTERPSTLTTASTARASRSGTRTRTRRAAAASRSTERAVAARRVQRDDAHRHPGRRPPAKPAARISADRAHSRSGKAAIEVAQVFVGPAVAGEAARQPPAATWRRWKP